MFHIKTIWDKIYFHPLFYLILIICLFTAHFYSIIYFTLLILIHELGHSIMGLIFGMKIERIEIYPFGGCSKLEYPINIRIVKELIMLVSGPIIQIIFTFSIYYLKIDVFRYFYTYSMFILFFNLLPIYPLDGGKIINILLSFFISFYNSLKITYYISYFFVCVITYISIIYYKNLFIYLIVISIVIELYKEIKKRYIIFNKFLLERYFNCYSFKKIKTIKNVVEMKRDYIHFFVINKNILTEKEYLNNIVFK